MESTNLLPDEAQKRFEEEKEALSKANHDLEIARIKAEAELDATRRAFESQKAAPQTAQISEEQWQRAEAETGLTRQQIMASSTLAKQIVDQSLTPLQQELEKAKKKAEDAESRAARLEAKTSVSSVEQDFFKSNPAYAAHEKEVREFIEMFPESERSDPKKFKTILEKSKVYVKGLVGGKVRDANRGSDGSARLSGGIDDTEGDTPSIDYTGLDNVHQRRVIEDVDRDIRDRLTDKEREVVFKKSMSSDGKGVTWDSADEFRRGDEMMKRGNRFGGSNK